VSYDLAIWKRSSTTKTAMLAEVHKAICDGADHPAMAPFDMDALEDALEAEFGEYKNNPDATIIGESGNGASANWLILQCAHSDANLVAAKVVPIAIKHGLLVYDPQRQVVWGNKRPAKTDRK
jgi:hypothetical protein